MSNTPTFDQSQYPPVIQEQSYKPHLGHGSVRPVIGVLAVIMVLGALAMMIGRLCSGRQVMRHVQYDFEGWVESKCATCIDGRLGSPPPHVRVPVVAVESGGSNVAASMAEEEVDEEMGHVEEVSHHQQPLEEQTLQNVDSGQP